MRKKMIKSKFGADESAGFLFIKVYNRWHGMIKKKLLEFGLTHPQFVILSNIMYLTDSFSKEINQKKLADFVMMDVMTVSQVLKLLEKKGYVVRSRSANDTRANSLVITEEGRTKVLETLPIIEDIDENFFDLANADLERFKEYLKLLV